MTWNGKRFQLWLAAGLILCTYSTAQSAISTERCALLVCPALPKIPCNDQSPCTYLDGSCHRAICPSDYFDDGATPRQKMLAHCLIDILHICPSIAKSLTTSTASKSPTAKARDKSKDPMHIKQKLPNENETKLTARPTKNPTSAIGGAIGGPLAIILAIIIGLAIFFFVKRHRNPNARAGTTAIKDDLLMLEVGE